MLALRLVPEDARSDWIDALADRLDALRFSRQYDDPRDSAKRAREFVQGAVEGSRVFEVTEHDLPVGHVWWGSEADGSSVMDVRLDEPARTSELMPLLFDLARADGHARIGTAGIPDDPTRMALIGQPGFVARATNMMLRLDAPVAGSGGLEIRRMTQEEFDTFHGHMGTDYAAELAAAGLSAEDADVQSRKQLAELIPDGLASPGQEFFTARVGNTPVGHLWLSTERPMAFVYDIVVREDQRRRGYGAAIMNAGAIWAREHGHFALGLNVFAHNPGARALYDRLGYVVTLDYRTVDVPDAG